jgi:hypothetical protein
VRCPVWRPLGLNRGTNSFHEPLHVDLVPSVARADRLLLRAVSAAHGPLSGWRVSPRPRVRGSDDRLRGAVLRMTCAVPGCISSPVARRSPCTNCGGPNADQGRCTSAGRARRGRCRGPGGRRAGPPRRARRRCPRRGGPGPGGSRRGLADVVALVGLEPAARPLDHVEGVPLGDALLDPAGQDVGGIDARRSPARLACSSAPGTPRGGGTRRGSSGGRTMSGRHADEHQQPAPPKRDEVNCQAKVRR